MHHLPAHFWHIALSESVYILSDRGKYGDSGSCRLAVIWISKVDVEQNAVIYKIWHKTVATKGSSTTNVFRQLKSHPLQNYECFKLRVWTSPHTPKKSLNKPAAVIRTTTARETGKTAHVSLIACYCLTCSIFVVFDTCSVGRSLLSDNVPLAWLCEVEWVRGFHVCLGTFYKIM